MKNILTVIFIILLTVGATDVSAFDGGYQSGSAVQQNIPFPVRNNPLYSTNIELVNRADSMDAQVNDPESSDRILKVPEPASILLLGTGLLMIGKLARKKNKI